MKLPWKEWTSPLFSKITETQEMFILCIILCHFTFASCLVTSQDYSPFLEIALMIYFKRFFLVWTDLQSLLNLLQYCFYFMFWFFGHEVCGILVPWPEIETTPLGLEGGFSTAGQPIIFIFKSLHLYMAAPCLILPCLPTWHQHCCIPILLWKTHFNSDFPCCP